MNDEEKELIAASVRDIAVARQGLISERNTGFHILKAKERLDGLEIKNILERWSVALVAYSLGILYELWIHDEVSNDEFHKMAESSQMSLRKMME